MIQISLHENIANDVTRCRREREKRVFQRSPFSRARQKGIAQPLGVRGSFVIRGGGERAEDNAEVTRIRDNVYHAYKSAGWTIVRCTRYARVVGCN